MANNKGQMRPNSIKSMVAAIIFAVISALLSGCASTQADKSANNVTPDISAVNPPGYDEWSNWNSGETLPEMKTLANLFGLAEVNIPTSPYLDLGYIGVSRLEEYCIVAFTMMDGKHLDATIMSRYNTTLVVIMPSLRHRKIDDMMDKYRGVCKGTEPVPTEAHAPGTSV